MSIEKRGDGTVAVAADCCLMCTLMTLYADLPSSIAIGGAVIGTLSACDKKEFGGAKSLIGAMCPAHRKVYDEALKHIETSAAEYDKKRAAENAGKN